MEFPTNQLLTKLVNFWPTWPTWPTFDQLDQFLTNLTNFWRTWSSWSISDQLFDQCDQLLANLINFWQTGPIFDQLDIYFLTNLTKLVNFWLSFDQLDNIGQNLSNFWPTWPTFDQLLTNLTNSWPTSDQCLSNFWTTWPDNKQPTAKQIELNRCSFGDANKNNTYFITNGDYEPNNCHQFSMYILSGISLDTRLWQRTTNCEADWIE